MAGLGPKLLLPSNRLSRYDPETEHGHNSHRGTDAHKRPEKSEHLGDVRPKIIFKCSLVKSLLHCMYIHTAFVDIYLYIYV
uniref:Uncharacterized protein n=1 Tax=Anguilla anguilla TaxID=7936 RepID=A0A0E9QL15_ANGAN